MDQRVTAAMKTLKKLAKLKKHVKPPVLSKTHDELYQREARHSLRKEKRDCCIAFKHSTSSLIHQYASPVPKPRYLKSENREMGEFPTALPAKPNNSPSTSLFAVPTTQPPAALSPLFLQFSASPTVSKPLFKSSNSVPLSNPSPTVPTTLLSVPPNPVQSSFFVENPSREDMLIDEGFIDDGSIED